jgi:putrescine transport system permease protein
MNPVSSQPRRSWTEKAVVRIPYVWLLVFFLLPFPILLRISLSQPASAQPPYASVFDLTAGWRGITALFGGFSFDNYRLLGTEPLYLVSFVKSVEIAAFSTLLLLLIGCPIAYGITRLPPRAQAVLLTLVMLPLLTAVLIRTYVWTNILQPDGSLNQLLLALRIVATPPLWLATDTAIYVGIVYCYLPLMVLPLYAALVKIDERFIETAADLGCPRWKIFWQVTMPLSAPGVLAGALLCFIAAVGEFVIPDLLGSLQTPMIGQTIWNEVFANKDWPAAAAVAVAPTAFLVTPLAIFLHQAVRATERAR